MIDRASLKIALLPLLGSFLSICFGLLAVAFFLFLTGRNPFTIYAGIATSAFGDNFALCETLVAATPVMFCALAVSIGTRVGLLNIGVEGQLLAGAAGATLVALNLPATTPCWQMLLSMCLSACLCGAVWSGIAGALKVFLQVNETIVSLLLNYVAVLVIDFLIHGPWQDPGSASWPQTQAFPACAELPHIADSRLHLGLPVAIIIGLVLALFWSTTSVGFKSRIIGENIEAAKYAHYPVRSYLLAAMLISGAVAALAGFSQVSAIEGRLRSGLSPGYGYSGFLVCFLARHNPVAIIIVSILLGGLLSGADSLQLSEKLPFATVNILQGAIFLFLLGSENFIAGWINKKRQLANSDRYTQNEGKVEGTIKS